MTKRELINALEASLHDDDTEVYVYPQGLREEDGLDPLDEEEPYPTIFLDTDISDRIDINF